MAAIDNVRAATVLQGMLGLAAFPASAIPPMWIRLMTANGSMTANGTEAGGAGYVAGGQSGFFSAVNTAGGLGPTSTGMTAAAALSWTAGTNWTGANAITGFEIWDNAALKLRWWFGTFTGGNVAVASGQVLQIATSAISVSLT
jgi:hypothetical protein